LLLKKEAAAERLFAGFIEKPQDSGHKAQIVASAKNRAAPRPKRYLPLYGYFHGTVF